MYIHCGLHKTGSTAVETSFAGGRDVLLRHGLLYPPSGRFPAHHNLAWELTCDPRFDRAGLCWKDLYPRIAAHGGDVLISSADFESRLDLPFAFEAVFDKIRALRREVCLIVYVRDRRSRMVSLYFELLKQGYAFPFIDFAAEIATKGRLRYDPFVFQFDEDWVTQVWQGGPGARLIRRSWPDALSEGVVPDLLSAIGLPRQALGPAALHRVNTRETLAVGLVLFGMNQLQRKLNPSEVALVSRVSRQLAFAEADVESVARGGSTRSKRSYAMERVFSPTTLGLITQAAARGGVTAMLENQLVEWWQNGEGAAVVASPPPEAELTDSVVPSQLNLVMT